jgi:hypothetical protein
MVHDIRVAQHLGSAGNRVTEQAPQSVFLERENIYHNEAQDAEAKTPGSPRQAPAPADGGFGVR